MPLAPLPPPHNDNNKKNKNNTKKEPKLSPDIDKEVKETTKQTKETEKVRGDSKSKQHKEEIIASPSLPMKGNMIIIISVSLAILPDLTFDHNSERFQYRCEEGRGR
jgi:hypothetical protein